MAPLHCLRWIYCIIQRYHNNLTKATLKTFIWSIGHHPFLFEFIPLEDTAIFLLIILFVICPPLDQVSDSSKDHRRPESLHLLSQFLQRSLHSIMECGS